MIELAIAVSAVLMLVMASVWADRRFQGQERLPMQWSFSGRVNWTARRRLALAFTPALGALVLLPAAVMVLVSGAPRPGQENLGAPVLLLLGAGLLAVHGLHLWLIDRSVR